MAIEISLYPSRCLRQSSRPWPPRCFEQSKQSHNLVSQRTHWREYGPPARRSQPAGNDGVAHLMTLQYPRRSAFFRHVKNSLKSNPKAPDGNIGRFAHLRFEIFFLVFDLVQSRILFSSQDLFRCELRRGSIEARRQTVQMTCRNRREQMVLGMKEHVVGKKIDPPTPLGSSEELPVAMMMNRPDGEKPRHAFAQQHGRKMKPKRPWDKQTDKAGHNQSADFARNPTFLRARAESPRRAMQANWKDRPN
jgi:hypothetical protein